MAIEITRGSLEEKVIRRLLEVYPITIDQLKSDLGISERILMRTVRGLVLREIIELEELPDKTFIRLQRKDFLFLGRDVTQRKRFKHKSGKKKESDYEGIMFG